MAVNPVPEGAPLPPYDESPHAAMLPSLPAIVVCPMGDAGVVIMGGWSPRCFTRSDERWLEGWSQRLRTTLEGVDVSPAMSDSA